MTRGTGFWGPGSGGKTSGGARAHLVVVQLLLSEDGLLVPHGARKPGAASHSRPLSPTRIPPRSPREGRGRGRGRAHEAGRGLWAGRQERAGPG